MWADANLKPLPDVTTSLGCANMLGVVVDVSGFRYGVAVISHFVIITLILLLSKMKVPKKNLHTAIVAQIANEACNFLLIQWNQYYGCAP